jgi:glycolate oxidase iron-sulfur subunit
MLEATRRKRLPAIASVESLSAASILTDEPDALRDMPLSEAGPVEGLLDGSTHTAVGPLTDEAAADAASEAAAVADRPLRVALLTGCVQAGLFARVNDATERVLRANGFEIVQVSGQQCCGALHAHAGDTDSARRLARVNIDVLLKSKADFVAVNAAGCGSALKEYGHLLRDDAKYSEAAAKLSPISRDVSELLAEAGVRRGASVPRRVTYDAACHLCHAQRLREAPRAMLEAIPDLDLLPLQGEDDCCGGAGIYGMTHPELGEQIGSDKVSAVIDTGADVVATANPGCIMQIGAGLMLRGSQIRALHPVELLDESYERAGFYR